MLQVGKPLDGMDLVELSRVKNLAFLSRVLLYLGLVAGLITAVVLTLGVLPYVAMVLLGLIYAHGVELQHQALHNTGFRSKFWNRFVGFFLGLPMLVSFSDYQHSHLRHHRLLGSESDREFFNYGYDRLTSLKPLLAHLLMLGHYRDVSKFMVTSCLGRLKPDMKRETAVRIRNEYIYTTLFVVSAVAVSIALETTLFIEIWLIPLVFAIPAHALIELPEHWGRDHSTLDVRRNTRTIRASPLAYWYTNGNNHHIEHHWLPGIPNDRLPELSKLIDTQIETTSYPAFFKAFFGDLYRNTFTRKVQKSGAA